MKHLKYTLLCLGMLALLPFNLAGQEPESAPEQKTYGPLELWGIGIKASTDGFGLEAVKGFGNRLNIRLGYSTLSVPISQEISMEGMAVKADAKLKFGGANLFIDFYPVKNVIHLTAGVVQNGMKHSVTVTPTSEYPYGDIMVPPSELGVIQAVLLPGIPFSPYGALGFGNTLSREHRVSFNFELGAMYHGAPKLDLTATNMLAPIASDHNEEVIMASIAQYKWFPMLSMQLTFRII